MVVRTRKVILKPSGIKNIGNTCFFNASIQCLLSISEFVTYYTETCFSSDLPVSQAFHNFIKEYGKSNVSSPNKFIEVISKKINLFNGDQQDAHEFVIRFFEVLHDELSHSNVNCKTKDEFIQHSSKNIIAKLFYSYNKQTILCTQCGFRSESYVLLNMIQIEAKDSTQQGISQFFEKEKIDGSNVWKCESCSYSKIATKSLEVIVYPSTLIVYIKRFSSLLHKNNIEIKIDDKVKFGNNQYYLCGVVCHSGSINSGHYYSSAKRAGKWINFDDSNVSNDNVFFDGSTPYMAFYTRTL